MENKQIQQQVAVDSSVDNRQLSIMSDRTNKKSFFKKKKSCPLSNKEAGQISYKNPELLSKFISEGGRILSRRVTYVASNKQKQLKNAIKIARKLALMKYCSNHR
jgi:small subunit ribosomal protein S18